jgi:flagellar assembly factor FliW
VRRQSLLENGDSVKHMLDSICFTRLFVSERKQIAIMADEKSPLRNKSLRNGVNMQINTKWFGTVEIDDAKVITFEKGLIGFEDCSRFAIVYETEDKKEKPIMWLQSLDEQALALPIIKPEYIVDEYAPDVEDELVYKLGENVKSDDLMIFVTMTVPSDLTKMTCNLKAPIIINTATMKAVQAVAANEDYVVRFPVYNLLKERKEKAGE